MYGKYEGSIHHNASFYGPGVRCPVPEERLNFTPRLSFRNTRAVSQWHVVGHPQAQDGLIKGTRDLQYPRSVGNRYGSTRVILDA